ncbi:MAG: hypothetical protein RML36_02060 [Anaerolineae bacterium]|nr:hypothetical protein [Anaerolineae bacterium]MDW8098253.1 hypothetical protein [Anaerolineae bacterium]
MRHFVSLLVLLILGGFLAGCVAMSPEQLEMYAAVRATEAAAIQTVAAARATEAAALAQIATAMATLTPAPTATPTVTLVAPTLEITATLPVTPTEVLTGTPTPTSTFTPTPTAMPSPTPTPSPTTSPTSTPPPTETPTPTSTPSSTPTSTPTPTTTLTPTETSTPTGTPIPSPTPTSTPQFETSVRVAGTTRVNVRTGPGMAWEPFATIAPGQEFRITGTNPERTWWRICCVAGNRTGWVSAQVTTARGDLSAVPVIQPVLPDDLSITWRLHWECHSPGCKFDQCEGQSMATVRKVLNERWLEVERKATWEGECGEPSTWIVQVDRYSGEEKPAPGDGQLFRIFENVAALGEANSRLTLNGREVLMWCTEPREREEEQEGGWTVIFQGGACYDLKTGVLLTMSYVKKWLYTGTFQGRRYERQDFGDYEVYEQVVKETNLPIGMSSP